MSAIVDLMLEGAVCQDCGEELGESVGYPRSCPDCEATEDSFIDDQLASPRKRSTNGPDEDEYGIPY